MTTDVSSPAQTLLPSRPTYRKAVQRDLLIAVPLLVLIVGSQVGLQLMQSSIAGDGTGLVWVYLGIVVAAVAFSIVYYSAVLRNSRIDLAATGLTVTNWYGRSRIVEYSQVGTVIQALLRLPARTLPMLFVLDHEGKRVLTMYGTLWTPDAMLALGKAVPVTPVAPAEPVSYRELRKLHPKAFSWARANPVALAVIVAGGLFLVVVVVIIVLFAVLASQFSA